MAKPGMHEQKPFRTNAVDQTSAFMDRRADRLLERGKAAVDRGDYVTALHEFRASTYVLRTAASLTNWGSMEHCLGDTHRAIELCHEAIALDPDWGSPYNNIGSYLVAMQRADDAIVWFKRAIACKRFDGSRQVPHINLGKLYCARQDYEQALTHLDEALLLDPANPEIHELAVRIRSQLS